MFKHSMLALALAGFIYAAPAVAQNSPQNNTPDQQSAPSAHEGHRDHRPMDPAKRTEKLTSKLNLTADQQAKVQEILKSAQSQMQSVHNDSTLSRDERRARMMDIHKTSKDQVRALLDATQQKKWDEMQANREQRMRRHRSGSQNQSDSGQ